MRKNDIGVFPRSDSDAVCPAELLIFCVAGAVAIHFLRDISAKVEPRAAAASQKSPESLTMASLW